ncbi:MAG: hypothetical protein ACRD1X_11220 [Vicinamibacteria bacterium]
MTKDRAYSNVAALAALLGLASGAIVVVLAITVYVQSSRIAELDGVRTKQHDRITILEHRTDRLDGVLDRALDATSIARTVLEEQKARVPR